VIKKVQVVLHEADKPDSVSDLIDDDVLVSEHSAIPHLLAFDTDAWNCDVSVFYFSVSCWLLPNLLFAEKA